ncbi:MAG: Ribosome maturation factor RimM [Chloroflexi bacterium]|nr:Ribosome maturation factor RimM [Chloroflexota bacterium]
MTSLNDSHSQDAKTTGSPINGEPVFVVVGKLRRPHGVRGEMKMTVMTDFPQSLRVGQEVFVGDNHRPLSIRSTRWHGDDMLIAFEEYFDRDEVGLHRNQMLFLPVEDLPPLPEGEFHFHELMGLKVVSDTGEELGSLTEILETGANDVLLIHNVDGEEILLPVIEEVILGVDLEKGEIRVHILPGLR